MQTSPREKEIECPLGARSEIGVGKKEIYGGFSGGTQQSSTTKNKLMKTNLATAGILCGGFILSLICP
jgi:hypothetical protein